MRQTCQKKNSCQNENKQTPSILHASVKGWVGLYEHNMATGNAKETGNSKSCEKRRVTYLSYLSYPSLKVPRTSEYRQKLAKTYDGETNATSWSDRATRLLNIMMLLLNFLYAITPVRLEKCLIKVRIHVYLNLGAAWRPWSILTVYIIAALKPWGILVVYIIAASRQGCLLIV